MIETGFFFFNTEAHPVDGAALECCRSFRSEEDDSELISELIDRYMDIKFGQFSFNRYEKSKEFKTLNQEYEELGRVEREKELQQDQDHEEYCKNKEDFKMTRKKPSLSDLRETGHNIPFTCFLNDSFNIHINTYNSFSYFP